MVFIKLLVFGVIFLLIKFIIKITLIKVFEIQQESYHKNFVNRKHKNMVLTVGVFLVVQIFLLYHLQKEEVISQTLFLGICFFLVSIRFLTDAYFWWKDDKKSRYSVLCIGETVFFIIVGIIVWQFGIFGLFKYEVL